MPQITDIFKNKTDRDEKTRAVLVSLNTGELTELQRSASLTELENLLETAGGEKVEIFSQNMPFPDPRTYIGSGKAEEIAEFIKKDGNISLAVFDNELTPSQIRNLENIIDVRVIDRTMLILDIFALHATTGEGRLQVEIACQKYTAPRLTGKGIDMSGQTATGSAGIATRGPGETKLETDRRRLKERINTLENRLKEVQKSKDLNRKKREKEGIPTAAIVGYTNSGKSTLLNYLTGAGVLAQDKLFATLDATTRRLSLPSGTEILLTDTVGFIDRLPTHLIKAFKSTLDELRLSDIIIMLTDASETDDERSRKNLVTEKLISELGASEKPLVKVYNKYDKALDKQFIPPDAVCISAKDGMNVDKLLEKIEKIASEQCKEAGFFFPHADAGKISALYALAKVKSVEYTEDGTLVNAVCDAAVKGKYKDFIIK